MATERFPLDSATVTEEVRPTLYQADCQWCGWHTRQAEERWWVERMARQHFEVCPNPHYRNGCLMKCGCWWEGYVGACAGKTTAPCPVHGTTLMVKANVACPTRSMSSDWEAVDA